MMNNTYVMEQSIRELEDLLAESENKLAELLEDYKFLADELKDIKASTEVAAKMVTLIQYRIDLVLALVEKKAASKK